MYNKYNIDNYYLIKSIVHKLNPVFKVILSVFLILMIILIHSIIDIVMISLYIITAIAWSNLNIKMYFQNIMIFKYILLLLFVLLLWPFDIITALLIILKLIYIIITLTMLSFTTPMTEIFYGIEKNLRIFNKKIDVNKITLKITLFLRFIPLLTEEYNKIKMINFIRNKQNNNSILYDAYKLSKIKNKHLLDNMEVRLYGYGVSRTNYRLNKVTKKDILLLVLNILMLIIIILY